MNAYSTPEYLLENLPVLLWTTDCELRITSFQGRHARAVGLTAATIVGQTLAEFYGTNDQFPGIVAHKRALSGEVGRYTRERDGHLFECRVEPLTDVHGQIIGTIGVALEIENRKQ